MNERADVLSSDLERVQRNNIVAIRETSMCWIGGRGGGGLRLKMNIPSLSRTVLLCCDVAQL